MTGPWTEWPSPNQGSSVSVGVFDGVHRGHRALLKRLDDVYEKTVLTFEPHPVEVLSPGTPPRLITTIDERVELLADAGVSRVGVLDLGEIRHLDPVEFVEEILLARLRLRHLVLGPDFRFGRDRTGDVSLLRQLGDHHGFAVEVVDLVEDRRGPVSSSRIRRLIESGRLAEATRELTKRFKISGPVIHGDGRGAEIGFPTANLAPPERKVIPADGVYAAFAHLRGAIEHAAVSVGVRPTFGGGERLIEAFIIGLEEDIYDEELTIEFVEYLRPELDYPDVSELTQQMREDVERSSRLLEKTTRNVG